MKRRQLLMGLTSAVAISGLSAGAASANWWDDIKTAVTGHVDDAISRFGDGETIDGTTIATAVFDETSRGRDAAHWANGSISIITKDGKKYVQLNEDFVSGPLPDGYVYISSEGNIHHEDDFNRNLSNHMFEVGPLKKGSGTSFYEVPVGLEVTTVVIWCKAFGQFIGSAEVK